MSNKIIHTCNVCGGKTKPMSTARLIYCQKCEDCGHSFVPKHQFSNLGAATALIGLVAASTLYNGKVDFKAKKKPKQSYAGKVYFWLSVLMTLVFVTIVGYIIPGEFLSIWLVVCVLIGYFGIDYFKSLFL